MAVGAVAAEGATVGTLVVLGFAAVFKLMSDQEYREKEKGT